MTMDELKPKQSAFIRSVGGTGALRHHLLDMGLRPKTEVTLQKIAPMGDPVQIELRGYEFIFFRYTCVQMTSFLEGSVENPNVSEDFPDALYTETMLMPARFGGSQFAVLPIKRIHPAKHSSFSVTGNGVSTNRMALPIHIYHVSHSPEWDLNFGFLKFEALRQ